MVGGLVEQKQRVGGHEHLREREARPLAAREHAHALLDVVAMEEERAEQAALLGGGPARRHRVHLSEHGVGLVELLELVLRVVGLRHVLAEGDRSGVGLEKSVDELHER